MSDASPAHLAVLGSPISHSRSPVIHRAAYRVLGLPWSYEAVEMTGERLGGFVGSLDSTWRGLSLTMPLKRDVLHLLAERDAVVDRVGAANTVLIDRGRLKGFNTDVMGTIEALRFGGVDRPRRVHLLGAGATAASVLIALVDMGVDDVHVFARSPERARSLAELGRREGTTVRVHEWGEAGRLTDQPDTVISTVPGGDAMPTFSEAVRRSATLFDVAYDPWPSALALEWTAVGGSVVSGLELLLRQAVGQVRVFVTGSPLQPLPNEAEVLDAMRSALV